jgi:hypothetical protein
LQAKSGAVSPIFNVVIFFLVIENQI